MTTRKRHEEHLKQVSASQVDAWERCQRYWWFGWVDRIERPTTGAMQAGKDIHAEIEHYLETGKVRVPEIANYDRYVNAAIPYLPDPAKAKELLVEHEFWLKLGHELPVWLGYIDILQCDAEPLKWVGFEAISHYMDPNDPAMLVLDTKTTSNFRYCKTPDELRKNTQLMSYCEYVYSMGHEGPIITGHLYIKRSPKRVPKVPMTKLVTVVVTREHVREQFERSRNNVRAMVDAKATITDAHQLDPNTSSCGMYGGCPFRSNCGLQLGDFLKAGTGTGKGKGKIMSSFLDKLRAKKEAAANKAKGNGVSTKGAADAPEVPSGVVPPDAPPRETSDEESAEIRADAQRKADARKEKAEKAEAKKEKAAAKKKAAADKKAAAAAKEAPTNGKSNGHAGGGGFVLYIDCTPTKKPEDVEPTLFEDWFAPIVMAMNESCQSEKDLPDFRLLAYGEEKAMVAIGVKDQIDKGLPEAMVVSSGTPGVKDALGQLIPHATRVVRAMRG